MSMCNEAGRSVRVVVSVAMIAGLAATASADDWTNAGGNQGRNGLTPISP